MRWDPTQYARFSDQRSRPFFDLTSRIDAIAPATVVDLGCGSGELTLALSERWPQASVRGIDSSPEMIAKAPVGHGVTFAVGPAETFDATGTDILVSNALLQWVPEHRRLLVDWAAQLSPDGWLAFQVPSNFDAPSHRLMRELAETPAWRSSLGGVLRGLDSVAEPEDYLKILAGQGMQVDAWRTEYLQVLPGVDPVLEWVRGTALRPVFAALTESQAAEFEAEYAQLLRVAYPAEDFGTAFPFRRTFVVAHRSPITPRT